MTTNCYCRGAAICDQGHHICTSCSCEVDGAPQETATGYGRINPSQARLDAWTARLEARR